MCDLVQYTRGADARRQEACLIDMQLLAYPGKQYHIQGAFQFLTMLLSCVSPCHCQMLDLGFRKRQRQVDMLSACNDAGEAGPG